MRRTQDQKRFAISEVVADWHELMIPQRTMRPSIACVNEQLDLQFAGSGHTIAQSATLGLHPIARKLLLISHLTEGRRLSWPDINISSEIFLHSPFC